MRNELQGATSEIDRMERNLVLLENCLFVDLGKNFDLTSSQDLVAVETQDCRVFYLK